MKRFRLAFGLSCLVLVALSPVFADDASESSQGVKLLQEAAERGDTDAKSNLGFCYYSGKGVEQDYSEAVKWWRCWCFSTGGRRNLAGCVQGNGFCRVS